MGTYRAPDDDCNPEPEMTTPNQFEQAHNSPASNTGILKPERPIDQQMRWKNMWKMVYTAESKQRSEPDDEIESLVRFKNYHYFILGRGYDQDLNLVFDSRTTTTTTTDSSSKMQKSCENPMRASKDDDDTLVSNEDSLSTGDDGLAKAHDSVALHSETQIDSENRQETSACDVQGEGDAAATSLVRKLSIQIDSSS